MTGRLFNRFLSDPRNKSALDRPIDHVLKTGGNVVEIGKVEHEMFHCVLDDATVKDILKRGGERLLKKTIADIRTAACKIGPVQSSIIDDREPVKGVHHRQDRQVEFYQEVGI